MRALFFVLLFLLRLGAQTTREPNSPEAKTAAKPLADKLESASQEERGAILAQLPPDFDFRPVLYVFYDRSTDFSDHYQWELSYRENEAGLLTAIASKRKNWIGTMYNLKALSQYRMTRYEEAIENFRRALAIMQEIGDKKGQADDWRGISNVESVRGNLTASQDAQEHALELWSQIDDQ